MLYTFSLPLACVQTSPLPQKKIHRHTQASLPLSARFFPPFSLNYIVPPMNHASLLWKATTSVVLEKNISKKQPESNELRKIALFKFISYLRYLHLLFYFISCNSLTLETFSVKHVCTMLPGSYAPENQDSFNRA